MSFASDGWKQLVSSLGYAETCLLGWNRCCDFSYQAEAAPRLFGWQAHQPVSGRSWAFCFEPGAAYLAEARWFEMALLR